jgi:hypothetical protein
MEHFVAGVAYTKGHLSLVSLIPRNISSLMSLVPRNILSLVSLITEEHFVTGVADTKEHFVAGVADTKEHLSLVSPMPQGNFFIAGVKDIDNRFLSCPKSQQVLPTRKIPKGIWS